MTAIEEIKERQERDWGRIIMEKEAQLLRRESQHLTVKSRERQLTMWEMERLNEVSDELNNITSKLTRMAIEERVRNDNKAQAA